MTPETGARLVSDFHRTPPISPTGKTGFRARPFHFQPLFRGLIAGSILAVSTLTAIPQAIAAPLKVLVVTAHPDDEVCMAGTIVRVARELGGAVDQVVITNGEGGFKYATPAEAIYGKKISDEKIGRRELPAIRKRELAAAGKILGVRSHEFLDEKDFGFTKDREEAFKGWKKDKILKALERKMKLGKYDYLFLLLPTTTTHGHHQAASLLALEARDKLPEEARPMAFGCWLEPADMVTLPEEEKPEITSSRTFLGAEGYPQSKPWPGEAWAFDRRRKFGVGDKLSYHLWVNWMIAEHKSQGAFQMMAGRYDLEKFVALGPETPEARKRTDAFFTELNGLPATTPVAPSP